MGMMAPLLLALALAGAGQLQKTTPVGSSFGLACDGKPIGTFAQATGLDVKMDMPDYRAGDSGNAGSFPPIPNILPSTFSMGRSPRNLGWA